MEANPPIYNTNFINDTISAIKLIEQVGSDGFKLNLDLGTVIQNGENLSELIGKVSVINHVHISEPGLKPVEERKLHSELRDILAKENYQGFVSIEMGKVDGHIFIRRKNEICEGDFFMIYEKQPGVPKFECFEYEKRKKDYVVLIPIINEGERIKKELQRAAKYKVSEYADIVICDGGSSDGCTEESKLKSLQVNTLLVKQDVGKQGAQLRMGIWWALQRGYEGIITIDGNNKDSIEDVPNFIEKLKEGYDLIQGSRFIKGGKAINTPVYQNGIG